MSKYPSSNFPSWPKTHLQLGRADAGGIGDADRDVSRTDECPHAIAHAAVPRHLQYAYSPQPGPQLV